MVDCIGASEVMEIEIKVDFYVKRTNSGNPST